MTVRRATILLIALIWVTSCGTPQRQEAWKLEKAEMVQTIERLEAENQKMQGILIEAKYPEIIIGYNSKTGCVVIPEETIADKKKVRFVNKTDIDVTFSFPNPIFNDPAVTVPPESERTLALASGASAYPETKYGVAAECYSPPLPGPFILIP